jgi:hypothetical protein
MTKLKDHPHDHDPDYLPIASTLQKLCDTYGWNKVLAIFSNDMPDYYKLRDREPRHKRVLRQARTNSKEKGTHD